MRRAAAGLFAGALVGGAAVVHAALPELGKDWIEVRSGRLVAFSSLSSRDTERIASRVQRFRRDVFGPDRPFRAAGSDTVKVFLFADKDLFQIYEPHGYAAYFQPADGVDYLLLKQERWEDSLRLAFSMEAMHLLGEASPGIPPWLRRGLADFYSTYRTGGSRVKVGHRIDWKFDVLQQATPLPWERVLEVGWFSPELHDPDQLRVFSAQAWILAHYVVTETDAGEEGVARYVAHLDVGSDRDAAFRKVFGFERSELPERASDYARGRGFDSIAFRRPPENDSDLRVTRSDLPRVRLLAELGEMAACLDPGANNTLARERARLADELLRAAMEIDPDLSAAHRGLGVLQLERGNAAGALPHLRRAVNLDSSDLRAQYLLARALLKPYSGRRVRFSVRKKDPPDAIVEARKALLACLAIDPDVADVHVLLGRTYLHDPGDPTPGIRTLRGILPLYPGRTDILFALVLLHLRGAQVDAAFPLLDPGDPTDQGWQQMRRTVVDEALRLAERAQKEGDTERARKLTVLVDERVVPWRLGGSAVAKLGTLRELESRQSTAPRARVLPPGEAERQHAEYVRALELSSQKKYKKALAILADLLALPNDEALHDSIVKLWDQVRFNRARALFERGEYAASLELAREVRRTTSEPGIRSLAKALAQNCRRAMQE